ncbi:uncharacterized protein [Linepithema humile]|uniref:uncharacterized protein n=1 Tax=Linepithema humile TaxID=83485 RepID=UPI00351E1875
MQELFKSTYIWSDSTIALTWISFPSRKWSVFVANRVGEIQRLTEPRSWRHIPSPFNPADMLSRGLNSHELINASSWWHGPEFLRQNNDQWPINKINSLSKQMPELLRTHANVAVLECGVIEEVLDKHSSLDKVCHIVAYCLRITRTRPKPSTLFISHEETSAVLLQICKIVQQRSFPEKYKSLINGETVHASSKILSLSPFLDKNGLIRVGGRLKNSNLSFDACHQILLPSNHNLTKRIILKAHVQNMHAGTQGTMAFVRQQFWPLSLCSTARKIVLECVRCFRAKPIFSEATMGSLPAGRITLGHSRTAVWITPGQ